jgi:hypothetical protein
LSLVDAILNADYVDGGRILLEERAASLIDDSERREFEAFTVDSMKLLWGADDVLTVFLPSPEGGVRRFVVRAGDRALSLTLAEGGWFFAEIESVELTREKLASETIAAEHGAILSLDGDDLARGWAWDGEALYAQRATRTEWNATEAVPGDPAVSAGRFFAEHLSSF